jgi:hypothetical protein
MAFRASGLRSIEIPSSVVVLGKMSFDSCKSLESVTFETGSRLERIEKSAFNGSGSKSIEIPPSVRSKAEIWAKWKGKYARIMIERETTHEELREATRKAFRQEASATKKWVIIAEADYEERDLPPRERVQHISDLCWDEVVQVAESSTIAREGYPKPEDIPNGYQWVRDKRDEEEIMVTAWDAKVIDETGRETDHAKELGPPQKFRWRVYPEETTDALRVRWRTERVERSGRGVFRDGEQLEIEGGEIVDVEWWTDRDQGTGQVRLIASDKEKRRDIKVSRDAGKQDIELALGWGELLSIDKKAPWKDGTWIRVERDRTRDPCTLEIRGAIRKTMRITRSTTTEIIIHLLGLAPAAYLTASDNGPDGRLRGCASQGIG